MTFYKKTILGITSGLLFFNSLSFGQTVIAEVEAEKGVLNGVTVSSAGSGYSGSGYVTDFNTQSDKLTVSVTVPSKAFYKVVIKYRSTAGEKTQFISINSTGDSPLIFKSANAFTDFDAGKYLLQKGTNTIAIKNSWGYVDLDKFTLYKAEKNTYDVTPNLVDANANADAKRLYSFLLTNFRKKIISGQTDWYSKEIKDMTKNAPMLIAYDFQHFTEGYAYLWKDGGFSFGAEDDGTTNKAIDFYNSTAKKGIVSFQWHWHSPSGGQVGKNTFYTAETAFDVTKAVQAGTTENTLILRDIDAIAVQLKKLSDAGVPVLWRPLHEAGGGWFWWGAKGPDACKKLYTIVYDRLMNYHGLHNLIWVWSSPETDWYPGNDKVDIVGHDSYPGEYNYGTQKNTFDILHTLTAGKKLIAMSENGPIPNPNDCLAYDSPWSYFMSWGDLVKQQNTDAHILEVYTNPRVLSLGTNYNYDTVALEQPDDIVLGLPGLELAKIQVYPSPTDDLMTLEGGLITGIDVYSIDGKRLLTAKAPITTVSLGHLKSGMYILHIHSQNKVYLRKILIKK